jgi:hypothetical protein
MKTVEAIRLHIGEQITCVELLFRVATELGKFTEKDCEGWQQRDAIRWLDQLMDRKQFKEMEPGDLLVAGIGSNPTQVGFLVSDKPRRIVHCEGNKCLEESYPTYMNFFLMGVYRFK